jgi:hypothetical protein
MRFPRKAWIGSQANLCEIRGGKMALGQVLL